MTQEKISALRALCIESAIRSYSNEGEWELNPTDVIRKAESYYRYCMDGAESQPKKLVAVAK